MAEKLDNSPEEEAVKDEAREFMTGLVGSGGGETASAATTSTPQGASILKAWKSEYNFATKDDKTKLMEKFWSLYDPDYVSIWKMTYDEADSNENLEDTIGFVKDLLAQSGMETVRCDCFALVYTLETLEIEGVWLFNGPDPERLFGANSETSWYTFKQLGPDANNLVKDAVTKMMAPIDNKLYGKVIQDTQIFC